MNKLYYSIGMLLTSSCIYVADAEDFYVKADLGVAQSNSVSSNEEDFYKRSKKKKFVNGLAYSVGVGYKLKNNLGAELLYHGVSNLKYSANIGNSAYKQKLQMNALMANVIYDLRLSSRYKFNPYLGVGLGYAQLKPSIASFNSKNATANFKAKRSSNFTYAISGGIAFHLNKRIKLDIEYKFQDLGKAQNLSSVQPPNYYRYKDFTAKAGFKIRTYSIMSGIRYSF